MSANTNPIFIGQRRAPLTAIIQAADGVNPKNLVVAGSYGTLVEALSIASADSADADVQLLMHDGSADHLLGTIPVPGLSGSNATQPSINVLDLLYLPWLTDDRTLIVGPGGTLKVAALAAVTGDLHIVAQAADY